MKQLKQETGEGLLVEGVKLPLALAELGLIEFGSRGGGDAVSAEKIVVAR